MASTSSQHGHDLSTAAPKIQPAMAFGQHQKKRSVTACNANSSAMKNNFGDLRVRIKGAYLARRNARDEHRTWREVGDQYGISGGMAYRIAVDGYEPKDPHIRFTLCLPALIPAPACPRCGIVHVSRCTANRKPRHDWRKDSDWLARLVEWISSA